MRTPRPLVPTLALGLALVTQACAGSQTRTAARPAAAPEQLTPVSNPGGTGPRGNEVQTTDVDGNGVPEVFKYFEQVEDAERPGEKKSVLVRQDLDLNWDTKIDLWRYFGADGLVTKEEWDADYDGQIDETRFFEAGAVVRSERDSNNDGHVDLTRFFKEGKLERKETDTNGDGKVDRWEYFAGRTIERIGVDKDFDGTVDAWARN